MSKYGNRKLKAPDGQVFDSVKEFHRWGVLRLLERAGRISDLKRQVKYELIPKQDGERSCYYVADFTYYENGKLVVEDCNVKRGMKENALQCKTTGCVCLGYRRGNDGKFEIVPAEAKVVQDIFQLYADGVSATQVVLYCNNKGYTTAHGKAFTRNSLRTILRNKKYIGIYEYEDVCIEDGIPAIVSRELFEKVQSMLKHNYSARAKTKAVTDYLLTTKVFCGHCGAPMIGESGTSRHGNTYHYYKCACRKRSSTACNKKTEKKEWLEEFVVRTIVDTALTDENIEDIATKAAALYEAESTDTRLLVSCEQTLADVNSRLNNILDLMEQGIATATTKDRLLDLESQKQDLEKRIEHERRKKPTLTKERIAFWLMSFRGGDTHDPEYQRRVIDTLLNSIYVYDTDPNGRKFVFSFNLSKHPTSTLTLSDVSDIVCSGVPKKADTHLGICFFWYGKRDSKNLNARLRWSLACRRSRRRQHLYFCPSPARAKMQTTPFAVQKMPQIPKSQHHVFYGGIPYSCMIKWLYSMNLSDYQALKPNIHLFPAFGSAAMRFWTEAVKKYFLIFTKNIKPKRSLLALYSRN